MAEAVSVSENQECAFREPSLRRLSRSDLETCPRWKHAFGGARKDHRYYELLEDTLPQDFEYGYFAVCDGTGAVRAVQPFFILEQDLLVGAGEAIVGLAARLRRLWPRFLTLRTLMVGCVAGEGHLDGEELTRKAIVRALASSIVSEARTLRASLVVLKEFPARYREPMRVFLDHGFVRVPSMPMTRLNISYRDFDDYMNRALNGATRRKLRKKFRAAESSAPITMSVMVDAAAIVDEIYPLYLAVYERSKLHFEKLTRAYLSSIGRRMPDKTRFLVWRQHERIVAFILCMIEGDALYAEYIGLDYGIALDLHLYHYAVRDMTEWAIANGFRWLRSSGLNYDPKLHLRHELDPVDLYARHVSPTANAILRRVLPLIEPTRHDPVLRKFPNYQELWSDS